MKTNKFIKAFGGSQNFELLDSIELSDIKSINLSREKLFSRQYCCITLWMKDGKGRCITNGDLSDVDIAEYFPRKICIAANIPFSAPIINHEDNKKVFVEFYPKTNLEWPLKCASCLIDDSFGAYWIHRY